MAGGGYDLRRALAGIYARVPLGMRLGLDPMRAACATFGNPERTFEAAHVAGTNGKGSVSAMVESIARASGLRTGLYTSPHLCRFAERIRINGEHVDDRALASLLGEALDGAPDLSFFETATMAAFLVFRAAKVDLAVLEVGIGGRLDATNVIPPPRVAAITRIALDHTDMLGPTLVDIAGEKAGIAKAGVEIVLGPIEGAPLATIERIAHDAGARTTRALADAEAAAFVRTASIGLAGDHQRDNAAIAYVMGARLGASEAARAEGIRTVAWPARLETIATPNGDVLLDAAHNPDGIDALVRYLQAHAARPERTALVFGALADKAWITMLETLAPTAGQRFYVRPEGRKAAEPADLAARAPGETPATLAEALEHARAAVGSAGLVVVAGSIFLVAHARAILLELERDPTVAL